MVKNIFKGRDIVFYTTIAAAILTILGLVNYVSADATVRSVFALVTASLAAEIVFILLITKGKDSQIVTLFPSISAVLMAAGIIISVTTQVDGLAYLVSGLYSFDDMRSFLFFAIFGILGMVMYIISSYLKMGKTK